MSDTKERIEHVADVIVPTPMPTPGAGPLARAWRWLFPVPSDFPDRFVPWLGKLAWRLAVYAGTLFALGAFANHRSYVGVLIFSVVLLVVGIVLHRALSARRVQRPGGWFTLVLVVMMGAGVGLVWYAGHWFSVAGFAGLSAIGFGLGQLVAEIRERRRWTGLIAAAFLLAAVVMLALSWVWGIGGIRLLAIGVLAVVPTISFGTEAVLNRSDDRPDAPLGTSYTPMIVGVAVALVAGIVVLHSVGGIWFALLLAVIALALVGMIASNTDAEIIFALVAVALIWSQYPHSTSAPIETAGGAAPQLLVLGDSYISGEGAQSYYAGTNTAGDGCRRSPTAWAPVVAKDLGLSLDFVACSGAEAGNILDEGQHVADNDLFGVHGQSNALSQLALYDALGRQGQPGWVFVSIGGNDIGFGDLVQACVVPGDCSELSQQWFDKLASLGPILDTTYQELERRFPGRVVVVPYPVPIRDNGCSILDSTLTDREHRFLNAFTTQLDATIRQAAARNGAMFVRGVPGAFADDLQICDAARSKTGVNYIALDPVEGPIDPSSWLHNSMHPNKTGHARMAAVIEQWLADPAQQQPEALAQVPAPVVDAKALLAEGNAVDTSATTGSVDNWNFDQTRYALGRRSVGALLILAGAWVAWVLFLHHRRQLRLKRPPPAG
jgi:lysophospholipase L1-like esterase